MLEAQLWEHIVAWALTVAPSIGTRAVTAAAPRQVALRAGQSDMHSRDEDPPKSYEYL